MWPALLLSACDAELGPTAARVLATDLRGNEWIIANLENNAINERQDLSELDPGVCEGEDNPVYCLLFEAGLRTTADGDEEIDLTWSQLDSSDGDDTSADDLVSRIAGVARTDHTLTWSIRGLDFSGIPQSGCKYDPADPCTLDPDLSDEAAWPCTLRMAHTVWVTGETDTDVSMWVADTRNDRLLDVTVARDSTCAVVHRVVDHDRAPDWDVYTSVNSLERLDLDGEAVLLMTVKGSEPDDLSGEDQEGGASRGKVILWREDPLEQIWEYPPQTAGTISFFNTPHGVAYLERPSGERWVLFAHSLGASVDPDYGDGTGGSVAVLRLDDDGPVYLYDAILPASQGVLHFPRDITPMPDGRVIVSDSGCVDDGCRYDTGLWVMDLPDATPTGKTGIWSVDHADQELLTVEADDGPYLAYTDMIYSAAVVPD